MGDCVQLTEDEDMFRCTWERDGEYSARSMYAALFVATKTDPTGDLIWKSRHWQFVGFCVYGAKEQVLDG